MVAVEPSVDLSSRQWCFRTAERPKWGLLVRVCVLCCCRRCESVSVLLCRDERKHWACWGVLPWSHVFWGRNYLVTRSWVADPWSDRGEEEKAAEPDFWLTENGSYRFQTVNDDVAHVKIFQDLFFQDANSFTPFIAALCVWCHKAIICLNPLYYTINLSFPQLLPLLFSKHHISWQSSLLTPHEPVIS